MSLVSELELSGCLLPDTAFIYPHFFLRLRKDVKLGRNSRSGSRSRSRTRSRSRSRSPRRQ